MAPITLLCKVVNIDKTYVSVKPIKNMITNSKDTDATYHITMTCEPYSVIVINEQLAYNKFTYPECYV